MMKMNALSHQFRDFVEKVSGIKVVDEVPVKPSRPFVASLYDLSLARVGDFQAGIVYVKDPKRFTPGLFQKHYASIEPDLGDGYVVVAKTLPSYVKTRLVEKGIPFVLPGVQISWPELGAFHRRRALSLPVEPKAAMAPAAQLVVTAFLCDKLPADRTATTLASHFKYSPMTMSRALREIAAVGCARLLPRGHGRELRFEQPKPVVWQAFKERMRNPIVRSLHVEVSSASGLRTLAGGETALAERSMLSPPAVPSRALKSTSSDRL
ncbi:MAG TPA: hypothetical protein VN229_05055, partial [Terriglobales bacterium]|nr:hypothetical protein [Terriglobales bacterium]